MATNYGAPPIVTDGLIYYIDPSSIKSWTGPNSNTVNDLIGTNNGTIYNDTSGSYGVNKSFQFDGTDDRIQTVSNIGISGNQDRTMSVWLKGGSTNNGKNWPMAVAFGGTSTNLAMWIGGGGSGATDWYFGWWGTDQDSNIRMDADTNWHLLTSTYNQSTQIAKGYIDGVEVVSDSRTGINTTDSTLLIGKHLSDTLYWEGPISTVCVWNVTLSAAEVLQNYNALKDRFV